MKKTLNTLFVAAAGVVLSAAAFGQEAIVANVPFSFHTLAGVNAAGRYTVIQERDVTKLLNTDTGKTRIVGIGIPDNYEQGKAPRLVFVCGEESGCALQSVRIADGRSWTFKAPHLKPNEAERLAVIYFGSTDAE